MNDAEDVVRGLFSHVDEMLNQDSEKLSLAIKGIMDEAERLGLSMKEKSLRDLVAEIKEKNPEFRIRIAML